jgi:hypothetical protein
MILRILGASVIALGLGFYTEGARAGQTFMCEDGRLLQVEARDIERLRRQDSCIAAYFGKTLHAVPLPVQRPAIAVGPVFKGAQAVEPEKRPVGAMAQVSTDFRKVRIINAQPGDRAWYSHTR